MDAPEHVKRVLIIGSTDGIGRGFAERLLAEDRFVHGISRRDATISHERATHTTCDVRAEQYPTALAEAWEASGPFDVCCYAAGIGTGFDETRLSAEREVLEVNLMGLVRTIEVVLPAMRQAGRGHIIGLSSLADRLVSDDGISYVASKAGMTAYLGGLSRRFRRGDLAITNVRFGFVDTKMAQAPVRPLMISVDRAVNVLMRSLHRRRAVVNAPWLAGVAAGALGQWCHARLRWT